METQTLPHGTTFLFKEFEITRRPECLTPDELPCKWNHFTPEISTPRSVWRWTDGRITREANTHGLSSHHTDPRLHSCTTLFLRRPDLDRFLVFPSDVRGTDIKRTPPCRWVDLGFHWVQLSGGEEHFYSEVHQIGDRETFVRRGTSSWNQLFPRVYNPGLSVNPETTNKGLTGTLSLLLALVAFSCEAQDLEYVLRTHIRLREWVRHDRPHGRRRDRGIVLAVWLDPDSTTDKATLEGMEGGSFGPIFRP